MTPDPVWLAALTMAACPWTATCNETAGSFQVDPAPETNVDLPDPAPEPV